MQQDFVELSDNFASGLTYAVVANYYQLGEQNVDVGWLSPFTYTQSAVNSWAGEELRDAGLELTLYSPGRACNSPISWEFHGSLFKANDPLGTLISWRGFAMHDRQSLKYVKMVFFHGITNNSDGYDVTLAWRFGLDKNWQIGA